MIKVVVPTINQGKFVWLSWNLGMEPYTRDSLMNYVYFEVGGMMNPLRILTYTCGPGEGNGGFGEVLKGRRTGGQVPI